MARTKQTARCVQVTIGGSSHLFLLVSKRCQVEDCFEPVHLDSTTCLSHHPTASPSLEMADVCLPPPIMEADVEEPTPLQAKPLAITEEVVVDSADSNIRAFVVNRSPTPACSRPVSPVKCASPNRGSPPRSPSAEKQIPQELMTPRDRSPVRKNPSCPKAPRKTYRPSQVKAPRMGLRAGSNPLPRRPEPSPINEWVEGVELLHPRQRAAHSCYCGGKLNITTTTVPGVPGLLIGVRRTLITCQRNCGYCISRLQPDGVAVVVPIVAPLAPANPWDLI